MRAISMLLRRPDNPWIINPPEETLLKHFVSGVMVRVRWWIFREDSYSGGGGLLPDGAVVKLRPSDNGGGRVLLRFWTFARFENWSSQRLSSGTSIFKIITTDDVTLWSKLESYGKSTRFY